MARRVRKRTRYGASKYAAFHLLLARWARLYAQAKSYRYVTLGGTELRDCLSLAFVDSRLVSHAVSFEEDLGRHKLAVTTSELLGDRVTVTCVAGNVFEVERETENPHLFFIDLEGSCQGADLPQQFGNMLSSETLREGDCALITSYLGRNVGERKLLARYDSEYRVLGIERREEQLRAYRRHHPSFTMFRALEGAELTRVLSVRCFGQVEYQGSSPMGLYGFTVEAGTTELRDLVNDVPFLHISELSAAAEAS
jgi:hypothetical protein